MFITSENDEAPPLRVVAMVFLGAWLLLMVPAVFLPNIHHPDEIFQTLEQAHRLVYGYGFVPWEFEHGVRSWLLPGFLAGVMQAARLVGDGPAIYLPAIAGVLSALGAAAVVCAFLWAHRLFGPTGARVAAALTAFGPDLVYFGAKALTEVVGGHLLIIAIFLAFPGREVTGRARLAAAGFLLVLAMAIRLQLAPAVAFVGMWALVRWPVARVVPFVIGGTVAMAAAGALDWATWGTPFISYWNNYTYNVTHGVGVFFGENPPSFYAVNLVIAWGGASAVLLFLVVMGWRFNPLLLGAALAIVLAHHLIAHKELRFLYPALFMLQILAGFGLVRCVDWLIRRGALGGGDGLPLSRARIRAGVGLLVLFLLGRFAGYVALAPDGLAWFANRDEAQASLAVSRLSSVCGIGSYGLGWSDTGGYVSFHQRVPFYQAATAEDFAAQAPAFNTVIYREALASHVPMPTLGCFGKVCVAQRSGPCAALPMKPLRAPPSLAGIAPIRPSWPPDPSTWR